MSGGHFDGRERQLEYVTEQVAGDESFSIDCPRLAKLLPEIGKVLRGIIQQYDRHICGDAYIKDMATFEEDAMCQIDRIVFIEGLNGD